MAYTTLISARELADNIGNPEWVVVDCRFSLGESEMGRQEYLKAHIPGAVYAHLNEDLSSPHISGMTGRHPLPDVERLTEKFSAWGIAAGVQVVAYDDFPAASGASAARLWWCLRWLGHEQVAVLDGGWRQWLLAGGRVTQEVEYRPPRRFVPHARPELVASLEKVEKIRNDKAYRLFDSRTADRYRGENETIDPVAGHIPGAISAPYTDNYGPDGLFLPAWELRKRFGVFMGEAPATKGVFYCGSGVTAAVNILAMHHAGLGDALLYSGSWSEWILDPQRPIGTK
jgi:thiosulfate/3-mercaptopyruvate sulfurtransferase